MLVLGLGTNLGDRLENLRTALKLINNIERIKIFKVSPVYQSEALLPDNAPADWHKNFLNVAVACSSDLPPLEILQAIKQIEEKLGRKKNQRWAPRIIDIDILAWNDLIFSQPDLQIPHPGLLERPFALWPLLDLLPHWQHPQTNIAAVFEAWGDRFTGNSPFKTKQIAQRVDTSCLVGILNVTPDSFSDGGLFTTVNKAVKQAEKLFAEGAEVIDIGAESTRPGAVVSTSPEQEWQVLSPLLQALKTHWPQESLKPKISVDTRHYQVAEQAINLGLDWINDVTGFADANMCAVVAKSQVKCVVMHSLSIPPSRHQVLIENISASQQVMQWAEQHLSNLIKRGIDKEQLILDVGIGFGKLPYQSMELIKNISQFKKLHIPLLMGHSRKSFLSLITQQPSAERDVATAIISYHLAQQNVDYLRVHNVGANMQALKIMSELN